MTYLTQASRATRIHEEARGFADYYVFSGSPDEGSRSKTSDEAAMKRTQTNPQSGTNKRSSTPKMTEVSVQGYKFRRSREAIEAQLPRVGWRKISSPISVVAEVRDEARADWGRLLKWKDKDGEPYKDYFSRAELSGSPGKVVKTLLNSGLKIVGTDAAQKRPLCLYLLGKPTTRRMRRVTRVGWCGNFFVVPNVTTTLTLLTPSHFKSGKTHGRGKMGSIGRKSPLG